MYRVWCQSYRFPKFKKWLSKGTSKIVIGCGNTYRKDFILAFIEDKAVRNQFLFHPGKQVTLPSEKTIELIELPKGSSKVEYLVITPFFGQGGLMADEDLTALGKIIKDL